MKEKIKSILFVFALALVFVGAAKVTEAAAAVDKYIDYENEKIDVAAVSGATYYQIVKDEDGSGLKANAWIKAAKAENNGARPYVIDISALANNKDSFIAVAGDPNAEDATEVFTVKALVKSMKVTLNYKVEVVTDSLYDVIAKVDVTPVKGDKKSVDSAIDSQVTLGWKRGANGDWKAASEFKTTEWQMMKNSNTTLYIRAEALGGENTKFSKEVKVKVPKTAKAPTVKVDLKKATVAIKNGMEFRVAGSNGKWITVGASAKNTDTEASTTEFLNVAKTTIKKSALTMDELKKALGDAYKAGEALNLEVRTSATDKKFMSYAALVEINATPVAAKNITGLDLSQAIAVVSGTDVTVDLTALYDAVGEGYEFALTGANADVASIDKYTELKDEVITSTTTKLKSAKYKEVGASRSKTVEYDMITTIYVRKKAEMDGKTQVGFAGEVFSFSIGKKAN